jgi:hypothetical protein
MFEMKLEEMDSIEFQANNTLLRVSECICKRQKTFNGMGKLGIIPTKHDTVSLILLFSFTF